MDDLISRQAAIDEINGLPKWIDTENGVCLDYADVIAVLSEHLPSAQPMRWIPCSERLPENGTIALVCGKNGGIRVARVFIPYATGNWNGDPNTNWWTIVGTGKPFSPVAWMPLPEPYEEK